MEQVIKDGPPLNIDHMILYQMFSDPTFFTQVPVFFFLKDQADEAVAKIIATVVDGQKPKNCIGCGDVKGIIKPVMLSFVGQVKKLSAAGPQGISALQPMVNYISRRRGFRPRPVSVYYRGDDGKIAAINL